jgi:hypothetical protein
MPARSAGSAAGEFFPAAGGATFRCGSLGGGRAAECKRPWGRQRNIGQNIDAPSAREDDVTGNDAQIAVIAAISFDYVGGTNREPPRQPVLQPIE